MLHDRTRISKRVHRINDDESLQCSRYLIGLDKEYLNKYSRRIAKGGESSARSEKISRIIEKAINESNNIN